MHEGRTRTARGVAVHLIAAPLRFLLRAQANVNVSRQFGGATSSDKTLRQSNFAAQVVYVPPTGSGAPKPPAALQQQQQATQPKQRLIGKTNTEYCTGAPMWNSNANRATCPHNQVGQGSRQVQHNLVE